MKISILIPAYNEAKLIGDCLRHVQEASGSFSALGWRVEIIVCDNNSTDATAQIARQAGAQVVFEPVNQISRARNTAAKAAGGEWFVFVDGDSYPSRALFAEVARLIQSGQCLAGGAVVHMDCPTLFAKSMVNLWNRISRWKKWVAGSFLFIEADAFHQLGGFSEELYASEEIELSRRLNQLAKATGKRMVIIETTPLHTSNRKLFLYSPADYLRVLIKAILTLGHSLKQRSALSPWYDGRR